MEARQTITISLSSLPAKIIRLLITTGQSIKKDDVVAIYECFGPVSVPDDTGELKTIYKLTREQLRSAYTGTIEKVLVRPDDTITAAR